jgi:hypothetical protein
VGKGNDRQWRIGHPTSFTFSMELADHKGCGIIDFVLDCLGPEAHKNFL